MKRKNHFSSTLLSAVVISSLIFISCTDNETTETSTATTTEQTTDTTATPLVAGENLGYGLDEEALRVVNKMPPWTPAKVKGKAVKTKVILPIKFELM